MKEVYPNYYKRFRCIADKCRHSCCIGWEIDIDETTMSYYNSLNTPIGERIRSSIEGETPHFVLKGDERCPFLNEKGLCDIIIECGKEALCDICSLHPRFRNFYTGFTETGLGLCCEEAARIVLSFKEKTVIELPENTELSDEEKTFLCERNEIFAILQNRQHSIAGRFSELSEKYGFEFSFSLEALCSTYLDLERLDEKWTKELESIRGYAFDNNVFYDNELAILFEQLCVYFVFRHLTDAIWYGDYSERVRFALMSCYIIGALVSYHKSLNGQIDIEEITEIVRMYSSEIEYSEDNLEMLMEM